MNTMMKGLLKLLSWLWLFTSSLFLMYAGWKPDYIKELVTGDHFFVFLYVIGAPLFLVAILILYFKLRSTRKRKEVHYANAIGEIAISLHAIEEALGRGSVYMQGAETMVEHATPSPSHPAGTEPGARARRVGFTLVELLVVVAILALLVSMLMPALARARDLARDSICRMNLRSVSAASHQYSGEFDGWLAQVSRELSMALAQGDGQAAAASQAEIEKLLTTTRQMTTAQMEAQGETLEGQARAIAAAADQTHDADRRAGMVREMLFDLLMNPRLHVVLQASLAQG